LLRSPRNDDHLSQRELLYYPAGFSTDSHCRARSMG
jgi:hypothetical protein